MEAQELLEYRNWVVVGDVLNEQKYAYRILNTLKQSGFNVEGVNPNSGVIYNSLTQINYKIDVIDLCINPIEGLKIIQEANLLSINKILIQPGAESEELLSFCKEKGIIAIEGCVLVELSYYKRKKR
ncbi:CoA-binding protein [Clostridium rectalis]|uniref:CoA-binding protein n=1 Tax=Clostridium rectalis TaxID=2040295 RepID=UPI000F63B3D8|nr:CoA-binding protein [Clostridium rectalis]